MADLFTRLEIDAWGGFVSTQSRLFQRIEDDLRRRFHITHAEFEALLRLTFAPDGRMRIQDLAARSLLSRSGMSRAIERLSRAGYVAREGAEEDGRGAYAVLTARGRSHFGEAARAHVTLVRREFLSRFTEAELRTLAGFWARLREPEATAAEATPEPAKAAPHAKKTSRPEASSRPARSRETTRRTRRPR